MENSSLFEVKAILKSLVLSSTEKMTIEQLNRDYRDTEGEAIPYRRLGYANIEEFFRAIPDTLRVFGSGPKAVVCFVASEKSSHIHDMIMKQKKPKPKFKNGNRTMSRSRPPINNRFDNNKQPVNHISGHQLCSFKSVNRKQAVRTVKLWNGPPPSSDPDLCTLPQSSGIELHRRANTRTIKENNTKKYENELNNLLKKNCFVTQQPAPPMSISKGTKNMFATKEMHSNKEEKTSLNDFKPVETTASTNTNHLFENIKAPKAEDQSHLIKKCSELEKLLTMRKQVRFLNPIKDDDLSNPTTFEEVVNKPVTEINTIKSVPVERNTNSVFDIPDEEEEQEDEAVPSFAAKPNVYRLDFPEHTVPFGSKIPAYKIPEDVVVGSCKKIFVTEIHSPFRFWFHLHQEEEQEIDLLMFQIERFYSKLKADELRIPLTSIMPGQVCATCYNGLWHRAEIVAPPVNNTVKVSFVDYGTVSEVKIEEIKFLASYFAQLPAQALRGCLSHIKPRQAHWSHEATLHFLNLTSELMLYAKITEIDTENQILYMILCNTYEEEIVQINKSLIENNYASYNNAWKIENIQNNNGKRVHHPREDFPTFSMIESGEYPNFTELYYLQKRGIDYEAIYDLILYNQTSILNKHENAPDIIRNLPYFLTTTNPFRSDIILDLCETILKSN